MKFNDKMKEVLLTTLPLAKIASGGKEISSRCPFCGDSQSDRSKRSFYVSIKEEEPMLFTCFRASCRVKGILTPDIIQQWSINDMELNSELIRYNREVLSLAKNKKYKDQEVYYLTNYAIPNDEMTQQKMAYISNRLGVNLSYNDLHQLKIAPNLIALLKENNLNTLTRHPLSVKDLNKYYVGFISQDNAFVNLRNITDKKVSNYLEERYEIYNIFGKYDNTRKMYTVPGQIVMDHMPIQIHFAEGIFDILSVYFNLRTNRSHSIYSAMCGVGALGLIKFFLINMRLVNVEFHYYIDKGTSYEYINMLIILLRELNIPFYVHENKFQGEKDFGVPLSSIEESIIKYT